MLYRRKFNLKAEGESSNSHFSFKRFFPGGFNLGLMRSTSTSLPCVGRSHGRRGRRRRGLPMPPPHHRVRNQLLAPRPCTRLLHSSCFRQVNEHWRGALALGIGCLVRYWALATLRQSQQCKTFGISPGWTAHIELRAKRQRSAQESGRRAECPHRVAGKASALGAGSDIPKSA
jgi:hypothetical protein